MSNVRERRNPQLFDRIAKFLLLKLSVCHAVYLVNGIFGTKYPPDSAVRFGRTDSIRKQGDVLEKLEPDTLISICGTTEADFELEFQIGNDDTIGLRIFEYGLEHAMLHKRILKHGELTELRMPEGGVVFWESTATTPDHITVRLNLHGKDAAYRIRVFKMADQRLESLEEEKLVMLLPFCLVRFRHELRKEDVTAGERYAIAEQEQGMVADLEGILRRSRDKGIVSVGDSITILEVMRLMHSELYGSYAEFQETTEALDALIRSSIRDYEAEFKAREQEVVQDALKEEQAKIIGLFKQGYTLEQVEQLLAQETGSSQ